MKPLKLSLFFAFMLCCSFVRAQTLADTIAALQKKLDSVEKAGRQNNAGQTTISNAPRREVVLDTQALTSAFKAAERFTKDPAPLYEHPYPQHKIASWIAFALLATFLYFAFFYFANSAICRSDSYYPDNSPKEVEKRPFSFAKVQLFWWTVIIVSCFIWFYARYGVLLPFNQTVILLLSGGMAVTLFGKKIDNTQLNNNRVNNNIGGAQFNNQPVRYQDMKDSQGVLTDILSDDNGISIHRLQAVIFNLVYGVAFVSAFLSNISAGQYPFLDFESWQLALLGISAAGYLTLKTTENSNNTREARMRDEGTNTTQLMNMMQNRNRVQNQNLQNIQQQNNIPPQNNQNQQGNESQ